MYLLFDFKIEKGKQTDHKVADRSPGAGPQSASTWNPACVEVIQRTIES